MSRRPFLDQSASRAGLQPAGEYLSVEGERRLLSLVLDMDVREAMLAIEHPNDDAEEDGDDRHFPILPLPPAS
jgi:hypothetical protein